MFERFRRRLADGRALAELMRSAEAVARSMGDGPPGAEHFLLASFEHPDGDARRVLAGFGATAASTREAIEAQYREALSRAGLGDGALAVGDNGFRPGVGANAGIAGDDGPLPMLYDARESARVLLRRMADVQGGARFRSGLVPAAVTWFDEGVAARTLRGLGIDREALRTAALADPPG